MFSNVKIGGFTGLFFSPSQEPITSSSSSNSKRRLMIVLHGLGDSAEGYRFLPEFLRLPNVEYLMINAPESYFIGYSWFEFPGNPLPGILRSRKLLGDLIDTLLGMGFIANHMALLGFSQGALICMDQALRADKAFAGVAAISGYVAAVEEFPKAFGSAALEQKFIATHGTQDDVIPIANPREQVARLRELGVMIEWKEYFKPHSIDEKDERRDLREFFSNCFR